MDKLTADMQTVSSEQRPFVIITAKKTLMNVLVEKMLEYFTFADPPAESVVSEITKQYQLMVEQSETAAQNLGGSNGPSAGPQSNKDREIAQLKAQIKMMQQGSSADVPQMRSQMREL
eukprot:CAMPEP_0176377152 /NCGR_PEP_ID=MMETSP0126-20121128/28688_1 /TAXON_ID=141414 ORGANISM="Strombidinopsis acuminatum, Strain SPMC142" /NCGR_SAMPLE_ID=MMETSP0126 /ASSEMBLY_ACC=CAM_ASM_000229 /LENGTH=117 /DNA_ID=CAMNT_0017738875 /DNA_START=758 /DNA_END=1111 /DNA_ORIENTATION=+